MEIDFSVLDNLGREKTSAEPATEAAAEGLGRLQRIADQNAAEREESRRICKKYQEAIKRTEKLRCEITKDIEAGEDQAEIILKLAKTVSIATGDTIFYTTVVKLMTQRKR